MKVLVVDDSQDMVNTIAKALETEGIGVIPLTKTDKIFETIADCHPDAILLDQVMPGKSGEEILREVRADKAIKDIPIVMVTGIGEERKIVEALESGADDYVTKPFMSKALAARIKAVIRRSKQPALVDQSFLSAAGVRVDLASHKVSVDGEEVSLTLTEFKILAELLREKSKVLTRDTLRTRVLGSLNVTDRTIDVHMASLRKKLTRNGAFIHTVRGVGYRFEE